MRASPHNDVRILRTEVEGPSTDEFCNHSMRVGTVNGSLKY